MSDSALLANCAETKQLASTGGRLQRGYAQTGAGQIHFRYAATAAAPGLPLLCLHLVPNSSQVFAAFMRPWSKVSPVIAMDLPGFGMSDPTDDPQRIETYAQAIAAACDDLGLREYHVLGYHTGAAVGAELALTQPSRVKRLMLVSIPVFNQEERDRYAALPPIPFDEDGDFVREEWRRSMKWRGPGQSVDSVKRTFAEKMRPGARELGAQAVVSYAMAETLGKLKLPMSLVGVKDDLWENSLRARQLRPDLPWDSLQNYGHGLFDAAPEEMVSMARRFFAGEQSS